MLTPPNYARFALILTDNAVELMLQEETDKLIAMDGAGGWLIKPKFSPEAKKTAQKGNFHTKNDFCLMAKSITPTEHMTIKVAHLVRNELYHSGVSHEAICRTLAWHYHDLVCEMLPRLLGWGFSWGSDDVISQTVIAYTTDSGLDFDDPKGCLQKAAKKLSKAKPNNAEPLPQVLSNAALAEIDATAEALEFLVSDNPNRINQAAIIRELQFYDYLRGTDISKVKTCKDWRDHEAKYASRWKPKYTRNPIPGWKRRARDISKVGENARALSRFASLRGDSKQFSRLIHDAASKLDAHQQMELDAYRGK